MTLKLTIGHQIDILFRRKKKETPEKGVLPQGSAVDAQVVMGTVVFSLYLSLCGRRNVLLHGQVFPDTHAM